MDPIPTFWLYEDPDSPEDGETVYLIPQDEGPPKRVTWTDAPLGAMRHAPELDGEYPGPDGMCVVVKIPEYPDGSGQYDWYIDGPDRDGKRVWERQGEVPLVTVPEKVSVRYPHGWAGFLRMGFLETSLNPLSLGK